MRFEQFLNEGIEDKGIFKAVFMTGTPGAGKSFVLNKITAGEIEPRIVNTDKFTEFLKAFGSKGWENYKEKIKILSKTQLRNYLNSLLPLWIDGTSSNSVSLLKRKKLLEKLGYDTAMIWVDTPLEDALKRAEKRGKEMGRTVDPIFIKETYQRLDKLKLYYASKFENFTEILNGDDELNDKVILSAYNKMKNFFLSPIKNKNGQVTIEMMKENNWKYINDGVHNKSYLDKLVSKWY